MENYWQTDVIEGDASKWINGRHQIQVKRKINKQLDNYIDVYNVELAEKAIWSVSELIKRRLGMCKFGTASLYLRDS